MYKVEKWTARGITSVERPTKTLANYQAKLYRNESDCLQTVVIKPNGDIRVCRNPSASLK